MLVSRTRRFSAVEPQKDDQVTVDVSSHTKDKIATDFSDVSSWYLKFFQVSLLMPRKCSFLDKVLLVFTILANIYIGFDVIFDCVFITKLPFVSAISMGVGISWSAFSFVCLTTQTYQSLKGNYHLYFKMLDNFLNNSKMNAMNKKYFRMLRMKFKILFAAITLMVFFSIAFSTYILLVKPNLYANYIFFAIRGFEKPMSSLPNLTLHSAVATFFYIIPQIIKMEIWLYSIFIFCFLLLPLKDVLCDFNKKMKEDEGSLSCIAERRKNYMKLVELVKFANSSLSVSLSAAFVYGILCSMLNFYVLLTLYTEQSFIAIFIQIFWTSAGLFYLFFPVFLAGQLSDLFGEPVDVLLKQDLSESNSNEILLFVNAVKQHDYGISCLGLFKIEKSLIATLIGIFITYFFLLVQLKPMFESNVALTTTSTYTYSSTSA